MVYSDFHKEAFEIINDGFYHNRGFYEKIKPSNRVRAIRAIISKKLNCRDAIDLKRSILGDTYKISISKLIELGADMALFKDISMYGWEAFEDRMVISVCPRYEKSYDDAYKVLSNKSLSKACEASGDPSRVSKGTSLALKHINSSEISVVDNPDGGSLFSVPLKEFLEKGLGRDYFKEMASLGWFIEDGILKFNT